MTINTDQQIYLLAEKKPNRAHANSNGHVLYYYSKSNTWIGSSYSFNPEGATHWMMLPDSPAPTKPLEELQEPDDVPARGIVGPDGQQLTG